MLFKIDISLFGPEENNVVSAFFYFLRSIFFVATFMWFLMLYKVDHIYSKWHIVSATVQDIESHQSSENNDKGYIVTYKALHDNMTFQGQKSLEFKPHYAVGDNVLLSLHPENPNKFVLYHDEKRRQQLFFTAIVFLLGWISCASAAYLTRSK